jgi:positive regulator of sigma E activity
MSNIAAAAASSSSVSFGEIIILVALIMVALGTVLGRKIENTFLSIIVQLVLILGAGVLIAAAYPHKLLVPLYHITGGKLGIP